MRTSIKIIDKLKRLSSTDLLNTPPKQEIFGSRGLIALKSAALLQGAYYSWCLFSFTMSLV